MSIDVRNIQTTKVQSISRALDSGVYFCNLFHVRYGISIEKAMKPETGNILMAVCWMTELNLKIA